MTTSTAPIIDRPERQSLHSRTVFGLLTAIAWFAYVYLWLPLLTLLAWLFGVRNAYSELFMRDNAIDPFLVLSLPLIALACALVLLGWAEYNRIRFQRRDTRHTVEHVSYQQVEAALGASSEAGRRLRQGRVLLLAMDEHAHPAVVNVQA